MVGYLDWKWCGELHGAMRLTIGRSDVRRNRLGDSDGNGIANLCVLQQHWTHNAPYAVNHIRAMFFFFICFSETFYYKAFLLLHQIAHSQSECKNCTFHTTKMHTNTTKTTCRSEAAIQIRWRGRWVPGGNPQHNICTLTSVSLAMAPAISVCFCVEGKVRKKVRIRKIRTRIRPN